MDCLNIKHILVYGAGMMGKNIALVLSANSDVKITVFDIHPVDIKTALTENFKPFLEAQVLSEEEIRQRVARVSFLENLTEEIGQRTDLVIECVFEDMALKQRTFQELERLCRPDTLFCTNTSVMSPTDISRNLVHGDRFMGTHFWNPAHLIPLVEVVMSDRTRPKAAQTVIDFLAACGKEPVLCKKDVPGFIANRMQHALWREAVSIVEHGIADAATVDKAVKNSFGLRLAQLGPLENADLAGLDLTWNIHNYVLRYLNDGHEPSPLLTQLKEAGKLGFKTGEGFYHWTPEEMAAVTAGLNDYLFRCMEGRNNPASKIDDEVG